MKRFINIFAVKTLLVLGIIILTGHPWQAGVFARPAELVKAVINYDPFTLELMVTQEVPFKIIQIESREILFALKGVDIAESFKVHGERKPKIRSVGVEKLQHGVVAVLIKGTEPFDYIRSEYVPSGSRFDIVLENPTAKKDSKKVAVTQKTAPKKPREKKSPETAVSEPASSTSADSPQKKEQPEKTAKIRPAEPAASGYPSKIDRPQSPYKGDISDMVQKINLSPCPSQEITQALALLEKGHFSQAFSRLDAAAKNSDPQCREQLLFLRAYSLLKATQPDDYVQLFRAERLFQDALIAYPESEFKPYGFASMALIHDALNNKAVSEGYFTVIEKDFPDYTGMPEVYYHLARIYEEDEFIDKALRYYELVYSSFPENTHTIDAGIGLGKMLFEKLRFVDSLSVFNHIMETEPKRIYDSYELLLHAGQANYRLSRSKAARENLIKVVNLFPDIDDKDVILSMVADTYGMENNLKKAKDLYQYVIDTYPGTSGYISSSMGLARYLEKTEDRIAIYEMIKTKFPDDTYARVAMMRLAEIYKDNGEYLKCITEIEDLLSTHPRGLRYEAVKLMQQAYEALFELENKNDEYTNVLNLYEENHETIDRMGSRQIAFQVGMGYLRGGLFEQAFNHLLEAYKLYDHKSRSPELLYGLGVAMDETARNEDAVKLFESFVKRYPKHEGRIDAMTRLGALYAEKDDMDRAVFWLSKAHDNTGDHLEKGHIQLKLSKIFSGQDAHDKAAVYLSNAVKSIASAPGENYNILSDAYRELGNTYLSLKKYVKAADAFSKALTLSDTPRARANLGFLIGDAYQKGNAIEKAKDAFEMVAESDDSVWARLARQRLSTLELARTVQNS